MGFFSDCQELEQIEESWQNETKELIGQIGHLQEENRRLRHNLSDTKEQIDSLQCNVQLIHRDYVLLF